MGAVKGASLLFLSLFELKCLCVFYCPLLWTESKSICLETGELLLLSLYVFIRIFCLFYKLRA